MTRKTLVVEYTATFKQEFQVDEGTEINEEDLAFSVRPSVEHASSSVPPVFTKVTLDGKEVELKK